MYRVAEQRDAALRPAVERQRLVQRPALRLLDELKTRVSGHRERTGRPADLEDV
jgi:hypothetical protein